MTALYIGFSLYRLFQPQQLVLGNYNIAKESIGKFLDSWEHI